MQEEEYKETELLVHECRCSMNVVEIKCPGSTPPIVGNAVRSTNVVRTGTAIHYTCDKGHVFEDGSRYKTAICDETTEEWRYVPDDCIGE